MKQSGFQNPVTLAFRPTREGRFSDSPIQTAEMELTEVYLKQTFVFCGLVIQLSMYFDMLLSECNSSRG